MNCGTRSSSSRSTNRGATSTRAASDRTMRRSISTLRSNPTSYQDGRSPTLRASRRCWRIRRTAAPMPGTMRRVPKIALMAAHGCRPSGIGAATAPRAPAHRVRGSGRAAARLSSWSPASTAYPTARCVTSSCGRARRGGSNHATVTIDIRLGSRRLLPPPSLPRRRRQFPVMKLTAVFSPERGGGLCHQGTTALSFGMQTRGRETTHRRGRGQLPRSKVSDVAWTCHIAGTITSNVFVGGQVVQLKNTRACSARVVLVRQIGGCRIVPGPVHQSREARPALLDAVTVQSTAWPLRVSPLRAKSSHLLR
jgi:hypothetical protein